MFYAIKNVSLLLFCNVYHPNINYNMKALMNTQLESLQVLLRSDVSILEYDSSSCACDCLKCQKLFICVSSGHWQ